MQKAALATGKYFYSRLVPGPGDLKIILLCIAAAITFWFLNALNNEFTTTIRYPLRYEYDRSTLILTGEMPQEVSVNMTGLGWRLLRKSYSHWLNPLTINVSDPYANKELSTQSLIPQIAGDFKEMKINYFEAETIPVNFDFIDSIEVHYVLADHGLSQRDSSVSMEIIPSSGWVTGPRKLLGQANTIIELKSLPKNIKAGQTYKIPLPAISGHQLLQHCRTDVTLSVSAGHIEGQSDTSSSEK